MENKERGAVVGSKDAPYITRLARTYARVGERGSGLVNVFAEEELARLASLMEDLSHGSADLAGENREWLVSLTECASRTIHAVSTSIDRDFWLGEGANRYLRAQKEALESRGCGSSICSSWREPTRSPMT